MSRRRAYRSAQQPARQGWDSCLVSILIVFGVWILYFIALAIAIARH